MKAAASAIRILRFSARRPVSGSVPAGATVLVLVAAGSTVLVVAGVLVLAGVLVAAGSTVLVVAGWLVVVGETVLVLVVAGVLLLVAVALSAPPTWLLVVLAGATTGPVVSGPAQAAS
ncbi:MAG: hypothetical protein OSA09_08100, partial [Acidimicrobiales bacterium]|nr:hypothetical protein [Acidimicrobiales bacterium]